MGCGSTLSHCCVCEHCGTHRDSERFRDYLEYMTQRVNRDRIILWKLKEEYETF